MARKYIKDYRLVETIGEGGRIRTDYEYIGDAYGYVREDESVAASRRRALYLCGAGWLLFIGALLPDSAAMETIWISLPFLFAALSLGILTEALITAPKPGKPMEHRQADRLENRFGSSAAFVIGLAGIALPGEIVNFLLGRALGWEDGVFCLCAAGLAAIGVLLFRRRNEFETQKVG